MKEHKYYGKRALLVRFYGMINELDKSSIVKSEIEWLIEHIRYELEVEVGILKTHMIMCYAKELALDYRIGHEEFFNRKDSDFINSLSNEELELEIKKYDLEIKEDRENKRKFINDGVELYQVKEDDEYLYSNMDDRQ